MGCRHARTQARKGPHTNQHTPPSTISVHNSNIWHESASSTCLDKTVVELTHVSDSFRGDFNLQSTPTPITTISMAFKTQTPYHSNDRHLAVTLCLTSNVD